MTFYTRRQLVVLVILLAVAGLGLVVGHWRRANPGVVDALEQLDRAPAPPPRVVSPRTEGRPRPAAISRVASEPRRARCGGTSREAPSSPAESEPATRVVAGDDMSSSTAW